jgi:hypothetical protein
LDINAKYISTNPSIEAILLLHGDSLEFVGQARVVEGDLWWVLEFYLLLVQQFYL